MLKWRQTVHAQCTCKSTLAIGGMLVSSWLLAVVNCPSVSGQCHFIKYMFSVLVVYTSWSGVSSWGKQNTANYWQTPVCIHRMNSECIMSFCYLHFLWCIWYSFIVCVFRLWSTVFDLACGINSILVI